MARPSPRSWTKETKHARRRPQRNGTVRPVLSLDFRRGPAAHAPDPALSRGWSGSDLTAEGGRTRGVAAHWWVSVAKCALRATAQPAMASAKKKRTRD